MKTKYKHIHFIQHDEPLLGGPAGWDCLNNQTQDKLGIVVFYDEWRKLCFSPMEGCIFDVECLRDIIHFLGQG